MGKPQIYNVKLNKKQKEELFKITHFGKRPVRQVNRASILLLAHEGKKDKEIARLIKVSPGLVQKTRRQFVQSGMQGALERKKIQGHPRKIDGRVEATTIATALSDPPQGRSGWTLRLIADHVVQLQVVPSISYKSVERILKKNKLSLG